MKHFFSPQAIVSGAVLVLANLLPLIGVAFFGWDAAWLLALYWFENVIVGFFAILRIGFAQGPNPSALDLVSTVARLSGAASPDSEAGSSLSRLLRGASKLGTMAFFLVHYGMFTAIHGVFVYAMFGLPRIELDEAFWVPASLFVSHGLSFVLNFMFRGEYLGTTPDAEMSRPYGRVAIMHVTILFGAFFLRNLGPAKSALVLLVLLKTAIDLVLHAVSHARYAQRPASVI